MDSRTIFLNLPNDNRPWRIIKQICTVYFQVMRGNCQYHAGMLQKITTVNKIDGRKFQFTNRESIMEHPHESTYKYECEGH